MDKVESNPQKQHLSPIEADVPHDWSPTFVFMDADHLKAELEAIEKARPPYAKGPPIAPTDDQAWRMADWFANHMRGGETETPGALAERLARLPSNLMPALDYRLKQIRRALAYATSCRGQDWDSTRTFAVPPVWARRWEMLLSGVMFPAYVAFFDIRKI